MSNESKENTLSEKVTAIAERGAEWYAEESSLRLLITAIPTIGGPLDVWISTKGQKIIEKRTTNLINELKSEMGTIAEDKVNYEFLESEDFFDLIVAAFESASRTKEQLKINLYAKIIKNSVVIEDVDFSSLEYIKIISELSLQEILVLKQLYETKGMNAFDDSIFSDFGNMSRDDFIFVLKRIERVGLIYEYRQPGGLASSSVNYKFSNVLKKINQYLE